jgi:hypothetical protein
MVQQQKIELHLEDELKHVAYPSPAARALLPVEVGMKSGSSLGESKSAESGPPPSTHHRRLLPRKASFSALQQRSMPCAVDLARPPHVASHKSVEDGQDWWRRRRAAHIYSLVGGGLDAPSSMLGSSLDAPSRTQGTLRSAGAWTPPPRTHASFARRRAASLLRVRPPGGGGLLLSDAALLPCCSERKRGRQSKGIRASQDV